MDVVAEFVSRYRREFDFSAQAGRLVADELEVRLHAAGVRAIVTYRATAGSEKEFKDEHGHCPSC